MAEIRFCTIVDVHWAQAPCLGQNFIFACVAKSHRLFFRASFPFSSSSLSFTFCFHYIHTGSRHSHVSAVVAVSTADNVQEKYSAVAKYGMLAFVVCAFCLHFDGFFKLLCWKRNATVATHTHRWIHWFHFPPGSFPFGQSAIPRSHGKSSNE